IVMNYAHGGSLKDNLQKISRMSWKKRLFILNSIIFGLTGIHQLRIVHKDLHSGNILMCNSLNENDDWNISLISDLGLSQPINKHSLKDEEICGVLPYMAPEVLRENSYTEKSDIFSFGMIMWEIAAGEPPFNNLSHDINLSLVVGVRPQIANSIPQFYASLIKRCWDMDPSKRPTAKELLNI
ncbi:kinase-like domain-containing protein, partial [Gigaspora rosea]